MALFIEDRDKKKTERAFSPYTLLEIDKETKQLALTLKKYSTDRVKPSFKQGQSNNFNNGIRSILLYLTLINFNSFP